MKAILLGYDDHVGLMELTYKAYQVLWPDCLLSFRVPINPSLVRHVQPCTHWLDAEVDFVGRFEYLDRDFGIVCGKMGIAPIELAVENPSSHAPYQDYYDDLTRRRIEEQFQQDIQRFGYRFDGGLK